MRKDVVDPELGINVVDLGLVYGIHVDDENVATMDMTLTSAACPLTDVIEDQTRQALCTGPVAVWSRTSGSTGSGCRRGARTRSPTRAATSCGPSASSGPPGPIGPRAHQPGLDLHDDDDIDAVETGASWKSRGSSDPDPVWSGAGAGTGARASDGARAAGGVVVGAGGRRDRLGELLGRAGPRSGSPGRTGSRTGTAGAAPAVSSPRRRPAGRSQLARPLRARTMTRCSPSTMTPSDEALVHLEHVDRAGAQQAQRRVSGAEVVGRSHAPSSCSGRTSPLPLREHRGLGQLEHQPVRRQPVVSSASDVADEARVSSWRGRDVDTDPQRRPVRPDTATTPRSPAGLLQHPAAQRDDEPGAFRRRDELGPADTVPRVGCRQRTSASTPIIRRSGGSPSAGSASGKLAPVQAVLSLPPSAASSACTGRSRVRSGCPALPRCLAAYIATSARRSSRSVDGGRRWPGRCWRHQQVIPASRIGRGRPSRSSRRRVRHWPAARAGQQQRELVAAEPGDGVLGPDASLHRSATRSAPRRRRRGRAGR